jgi:hypothetical protein
MGGGKALNNATFTRTTLLGGCVAHAINHAKPAVLLFPGSAVGETCRPGAGILSASPGKTALTSSDTPPCAHTIKMIQLKVSCIPFERSTVSGMALTWSQTLLNCIDNSGAAVVECVNVLKKKRPATVGGLYIYCISTINRL